MHLLKLDDDGEVRLIKGFHDGNTPSYAILSHTWGLPQDEVTFQDITSGRGKDKLGYEKILFCSKQTRKTGLEYFWMDTCCIDQSHYAELSESITSMYRWYQTAVRCYVYLDDVCTKQQWEPSFRQCRWFTRGWTLQELLAPVSVEFFSRDGLFLGNKHTLSVLIQDITGIPVSALQGTTPLSEFSPRIKMQWASSRQTTRPEDMVYCVQGIFNVYIVPNYGERDYALVRLKREIGASYETQVGEFRSLLTGSNAHNSIIDVMEQKWSLKDLCNALKFDRMYSRQTTIKAAYSTTCTWLLQSQAYMDWMNRDKSEPDSRFLWIKGKPGAGKSTLIKYAFAQAKEYCDEEIVISFFFHARGSWLEQSTVGMYRSLLFQLIQHITKNLQHAPALLEIFDDIPSLGLQLRSSEWDLETLRELLTYTVGQLQYRRLRCFIDALDECDEQDIRDMVVHLEDLGQLSKGRNFHVCFSSRHYPSILLRNGTQLIIEKEPGHNRDLTEYIHDHLHIGRSKALNRVQKRIGNKANGIFMWAVLVVNLVNREFCNGRIHNLEERIEEIPEELSLLFKDIVRKDPTNMDDLLLCIQLIMFTKWRLRPREFYCAMMAGLNPSSSITTKWDAELISEEDIERFVVFSSKGLAELTQPDSSRKVATHRSVEFIHESVRDFLIRDDGLYELWPEMRTDFRARVNDRLRKCCQNYLTMNMEKYIPQAGPLDHKSHRDRIRRLFPFSTYAAANIFDHAEVAAEAIPQEDLLTSLFLQNWYYIEVLLDGHAASSRTTDNLTSRWLNSALHNASRRGLSKMMKLLLENGADPNAWESRYDYEASALFAAVRMSNEESVKILLDAGADVNVSVRDERGENTALHWAASTANLTIMKLLLDKGADVNATVKRNGGGSTALSFALTKNNGDMLTLLLDAGADLNAVIPHRHGQSDAVFLAVEKRFHKIARLLLERGANVNAHKICGHDGCNALYAAAGSGDRYMVNLMLEKGADVNVQGNQFGFGNALFAASDRGHREIVKLLLDAGADVKADVHGNALQVASMRGYKGIVKLLLDAGANPNAQGLQYGGSALYLASRRGHLEVVDLLIGAGADLDTLECRPFDSKPLGAERGGATREVKKFS